MKKQIIKFCLLFSLFFITTTAFAADLGEIARELDDPMLIVNKLLYVAAYIVGAILFFTGISQYKIHKKTPKLVPLTTPIFIWVLSLVCLLLPLLAKFMDMDNASPEKREEKVAPSQIFQRPPSSSEPRLIVPEQGQSSQTGPSRTYDSPYNQPEEPPLDTGEGHWSDDL